MADAGLSTKAKSLGAIYREQEGRFTKHIEEEHRRAVTELRAQLQQEDSDPQDYVQLANHLERLGEHKAAIAELKNGLDRCPNHAGLRRATVVSLAEGNRTKEAIEVARVGAKLFPEDPWFRLMEALTLPVLYVLPHEIDEYQKQFARGLEKLHEDLRLDTPDERRAALKAIGEHSIFYLAQQGRDVRGPQERYRQLVQRVLARNLPEWMKPREMPGLSNDRRIRVGYISPYFHQHSDSKCFLGWVTELNRQQFELFTFHLGEKKDTTTDEIREASDHFHHLPGNLDQASEEILRANLHVAIYFSIDVPIIVELTSLHLAPIQCAAWGRPFTSGSPAIEFFLSSALAEPDNGQDHYSERLVRLPGIGICYPKPVIPRAVLGRKRADFGLREDRTVYLCCQSPFKYLPQHDDVIARIAKRVPASQFVFIVPNESVRDDFARRLNNAFSQEGLNATDFCILLPRNLPTFDYWNLNIVSDVYLDTIDFSGGVSTMEAIACGLPVVTLPGEFLRARHSYAILTQLGVLDTIAHSKTEYVDIAVRLGLEPTWRKQTVKRLNAGHDLLFGDTRSVRALEDVFRRAVEESIAK